MHVQLSSFYIVYIYHYYGMSYISCHAIIMSHIPCIYLKIIYQTYHIYYIYYILYMMYIYYIYYIYITYIYYMYIYIYTYIYNTVEKIKCSDNS